MLRRVVMSRAREDVVQCVGCELPRRVSVRREAVTVQLRVDLISCVQLAQRSLEHANSAVGRRRVHGDYLDMPSSQLVVSTTQEVCDVMHRGGGEQVNDASEDLLHSCNRCRLVGVLKHHSIQVAFTVERLSGL